MTTRNAYIIKVNESLYKQCWVATSKTWTRTLKNLDPEKSGSSKTWTLKSINPEKYGINMELKICLTLESYVL